MKWGELRDWGQRTEVGVTARLTYVYLAAHANRSGHAWPSMSTLTTETGMGERTIRRALRELEAFGEIAAQVRAGRSTLYRLHPQPGQSGPPANLAPRPEMVKTPAKSDRKGGHSGPQKELKDKEGPQPTFSTGTGWLDEPVHNDEPVDSARNVSAVKVARAQIRAAKSERRW